jgi:replicative DNA helicase
MVIAQGVEYAAEAVVKIAEATPWIERGVDLPLLSSREAYARYCERVRTSQNSAIDLARWLPSLRAWSRPLMPGDMMVIQADTGVGKTALLLNLAYSQRPLPCILFEIELSECAIVERLIARDQDVPTLEVESRVRDGREFDVSGWGNIYICPDSKVDARKMEDIIERAELKIGKRPALVLIDYIGLMDGPGGKRYERISTVAEEIKRLARATDTVICVASQLRRDPERTEVGLSDGKDSGSIECSAQLVMGAWRPQLDRLTLRILKQTLRAGTHDIQCLYDGNRQRIVEMSNERTEN